jgi:hypothetical protein
MEAGKQSAGDQAATCVSAAGQVRSATEPPGAQRGYGKTDRARRERPVHSKLAFPYPLAEDALMTPFLPPRLFQLADPGSCWWALSSSVREAKIAMLRRGVSDAKFEQCWRC